MLLKSLKKIIHKILPYDFEMYFRKYDINRSLPPLLYNTNGDLMYYAYLQANSSAHHPYMLCDGPLPSRIIWDRYNYALNTHFYCDEDMFHVKKTGLHHYGRLAEAEVIIPDTWNRIRKNKEYIENEFDKIFTHSAEILDEFKNAKFCPAGAVWYGSPQWGGKGNNIEKNKMISIVSSTKRSCPLHVFRLELAKHLLNYDNIDVYGTVVGKYAKPIDIFENYRYSICIENEIQPYWFTEKITNCFASKTIPIYYGASKINQFFNTDGILFIEEPTFEAVDKVLKKCSPQDYNDRKDAIEDNFRRVKDYMCPEDYIYNNYPEIFK